MDLRGKKIVVIGGDGLIGSHTVDALTREDVAEIIIYDNFVRGTHENLVEAFRDPRVKVFDVGGDICQPDILNAALKDADGVFHFAALGYCSVMNILTRLSRPTSGEHVMFFRRASQTMSNASSTPHRPRCMAMLSKSR